MKTALYLLSAGALIAQAKLRPEAQDDQFSFWSSIGDAFKSAADHVASGVTSAAGTVASGVTTAADTVASGTTSAADAVANGVTSTATTAGDAIAGFTLKAYQASASVVDQVADDFENGADFIAANSDWVAVTFGNPQTYITAIQKTAQAISTYYNDLNAYTGGQLTIENLEMVDEVLDFAFPEGAVVFDGVTIALELAVGTADVTEEVNGIIDGFQSKNYTEVIQNSFQLFQTIVELSGEGEDGDDDGDADAAEDF